ncbi:hypothetical protein M427DRAFT_53244 [Gonapodya prolifera JEL478]|uniref:Uncharacterized protein n=1 Tax=Gonapodya prolifera (strain JEL478) TaxID=1344416 RepID=A0A139ARY5_GONPJ|nr:hypothetical protein M427DRAFT_53244 [Gonapodya prolifera JEL478]|eukprot:KXS19303.1 hypothetical protein M427DRAFT_53244 [Gonapodya prolifera JEL478]
MATHTLRPQRSSEVDRAQSGYPDRVCAGQWAARASLHAKAEPPSPSFPPAPPIPSPSSDPQNPTHHFSTLPLVHPPHPLLYPARHPSQTLCSSPHPISHMRLLLLPVPPRETPAERAYRMKREDVTRWSHEWWEASNMEFESEKEAYVKEGECLVTVFVGVEGVWRVRNCWCRRTSRGCH